MFEGVITALATPFLPSESGDGEIDYASFEALIEYQLKAGVHGFVVYGTTGESPTLTTDEKLSLVRKAKEVVKGRVPLIAGVGSNCTRSSIALAKK